MTTGGARIRCPVRSTEQILERFSMKATTTSERVPENLRGEYAGCFFHRPPVPSSELPSHATYFLQHQFTPILIYLPHFGSHDIFPHPPSPTLPPWCATRFS